MLLPKLIPIIPQKPNGKQTEQNAPERPPQRQMSDEGGVVDFDGEGVGGDLEAQGVQGVVDAHVRVLELEGGDAQQGVGRGGEGG